MAPTFEETCKEYTVLGNLISKANPEIREVLKRLFGFSSHLLGPGPTKSHLAMNTLKFVIDELVKKPVKQERQLLNTVGEDNIKTQGLIEKSQDGSSEAKDGDDNLETTGTQVMRESCNKGSGDGFKMVKKICRNFARNRCKRGVECRFSHPEICPIFAKFGPHRETNPKGCSVKNCDLLHVRSKWCIKAVKFNKCKNPVCKYQHFKGVLTIAKPNLELKKATRFQPTKTLAGDNSSAKPSHISYADAVRQVDGTFTQKTQKPQPFLGKDGLDLQQFMTQMLERMTNLERRVQFQITSPWQH